MMLLFIFLVICIDALVVIHPINSQVPINTEIDFYRIPSRAGQGLQHASVVLSIPIPESMIDCWVILEDTKTHPSTVSFQKPTQNGTYVKLTFSWYGGYFLVGIGFT